MNKELVLNIKGRVQGVSFRVYTQKEAQSLNLTGYVKNEQDNSVTIVAQGEKQNLEKLFEWAKHGPKMAYVKTVKLNWQNPKEEYKDFSIQY